MSDVRERMQGLTRDLAGMPAPPVAVVRRKAERRRVTDGVLIAAGLAGIVAGSAVALGLSGGDTGTVQMPATTVTPVTPPSISASTSPDAPDPTKAWLPEPWVVLESRSYLWDGKDTTPDVFCGHSQDWHEPMTVATQVLRHPSGREARLTLLTTSRTGDDVQLMKLNYSSCREQGNAQGIPGPRNVWSLKQGAGAGQPVAGSFYVVVMSAPGPNPPDRDDAATVLNAWIGPDPAPPSIGGEPPPQGQGSASS